MIDSIIRFFKSFDFYKGFILVLSIIIAITVGLQLGRLELGISVALGIFVSAPADVPGSARHRLIGIIVATLVAVISTIVISFAALNIWVLFPVLALLIFFISYISVYGFRASLVSFAGLLAVVLSFAHPQTGTDIFLHAGLIGIGGLWYLLFSHLSHLITQEGHTAQLMAECMELTADYLRTRGKLAVTEGKKEDLQIRLLMLQTDINAKHETLREILLSKRRNSGQSNFSRRQVLIFIELIDILELAIGNVLIGQKAQEIFKEHPEKGKPLTALVFEMALQLDYLSKVMGGNKPQMPHNAIRELLKQAEKNLSIYKEEVKTGEAREGIITMQHVFDYLQKQAQKIQVIQKVMNNLVQKDQIWLKSRDSSKFITQQDYDLKTFTENFSFKSSIFKHSLRLTLTVLVGFAIGTLFSFQNTYWILITIIVIMRPGYSLTRQRSKHRLYGTLIGGAIAIGMVLVIQNDIIYGVLAIITFVLAFGLVQKNYKSSAIFITLNIVFLYALIQPEVLNVIQFRVVDTLTGAGLAIIANSIFWPSWEFLSIQGFISETFMANRIYLQEINNYYHHKNNTDPSYKLARKRAFLAIGNLNAAFQRMTQEPKSRQKNMAKIYELVVLNHTFLSLSASLGTYIHHHKTTAASKHFESYIASICNNLITASRMLNQHEIDDVLLEGEVSEAQKYLDEKYQALMKQNGYLLPEEGKTELHPELQELGLITEQLRWLHTISENMKSIVEMQEKRDNTA